MSFVFRGFRGDMESEFSEYVPKRTTMEYNETLRALESDTASSTTSMTDEEINALPAHTYKVPVPTKDGSAGLTSSSCATEVKQENGGTEGNVKGTEELTCTICLEQVKRGELVRSLPCLHQVHSPATVSEVVMLDQVDMLFFI